MTVRPLASLSVTGRGRSAVTSGPGAGGAIRSAPVAGVHILIPAGVASGATATVLASAIGSLDFSGAAGM